MYVFVPDGARVEGDAVSFGGRVHIEEGGEVEGDRVALGGDAATDAISEIPHWEGAMRPAPLTGWLSGLGRRIAMLLGFAGAGVLVVGLWPRNVTQVSRAVVEHPVWYGVAGAILTASLSLGALLLTITLLGIPVAMFLLGLLAVAWLLGLVAFCSAAGEHLPFARDRGSWAAFLAGAGVLAVVAMVPVIGSVLVFALGFPAVGAALLTRLGSRVESPA